ncbi:erythromycin esterase family protein [Nocardia uniformis]|uniref:Erythromycin esterase family protein n=1 Tax=Nocardia uniformis TaxID=53432 RepID=A0A849C958_9NOCA|nr:erythromycin esterase family protein [Nocardia uniformis]NNH71389.1 erythromycin esterase family protein [Nocardia uniformis]
MEFSNAEGQGDRVTPSLEELTVRQWIGRAARPLVTVRPSAPRDDLRPLVEMVADAPVVGYGGGTRGAHEVFALQDRIARLLVGEAGFRVIALDQDWTLGLRLDAFVRTGIGDPREILGEAEAFAATEEVLALIRWVRDFNQDHPADPVRVVGVSPHAVDHRAYDTVVEYMREVAADRVADLAELYADALPSGDIDAHVDHFRGLPDRSGRVERVRDAYRLVANVAADHGESGWALQAARVIVQFHELHDHDSTPDDPLNMAYYEAAFAENVEWWYRHSGRKVLFWSSSSHTANARHRGFPPNPADVSPSAGSYLRDRLGPGYRSVGLTFHEGDLATFEGRNRVHVPEASPRLFEAMLGSVGHNYYLLDLSADQPAAVTDWLSRTAEFRMIGRNYDTDDGHYMTGGSARELFDIIVHCHHVTPARPLRPFPG